jgi:hypothetical protein
MYITITYNMYTICIRNTARSKSIPLLCTHVGSYKFRKVHPPSQYLVLNNFMVRAPHLIKQYASAEKKGC